MILEHGVLDQGFHPTPSVQDAIDRARAGGGVAWIGFQDPGDAELSPILHAVIQDTYRLGQRVMRAGRAVRPLAHGLSETAADDRFAGDAAVHQAILRLRTVAEDLAERVTWAEQTLASLVDTVLGLTTQRTNELAARQSVVAQQISAYALLFAIPNAVFALYGVNFEHLPAILTKESGFAVLLVLTAVLVALVAWRLRRNGWL